MESMVKSVFKILLGTIVFMYASMVVIELYNISITPVFLRQYIKQSAYQAAVLSAQESYRTADGRIVKMRDIKTAGGVKYISGDFYLSNNSDQIWNSIYNSTEFSEFCNGGSSRNTGTTVRTAMKSVDCLYKYMHYTAPAQPNFNSSQAEFDAYNDYKRGEAFFNSKITMNNLGVTYIPKDISNRMFKWNIGELLGAGQDTASGIKTNIIKDDLGRDVINYKGFYVYADKAEIVEIEYLILDIETDDISNYVNVNKNVLSSYMHNDALRSLGNTAIGDVDEDNKQLIIAGIYYYIPISYHGVTHIKRAFNYIWNNQVAGLDDTNDVWEHEYYDDNRRDTISGGFNRYNRGMLYSTGTLYYTVIQ